MEKIHVAFPHKLFRCSDFAKCKTVVKPVLVRNYFGRMLKNRRRKHVNFKVVKSVGHVAKNNSTSGKNCSDRPQKRKRKRQWKPYSKLNFKERQKLEKRECKKAIRIRQELSSNGLTLAPYNTTQFLMDDCELRDSALQNLKSEFESTGSVSPYDSSADIDFWEQQFTKDYNDCHAELRQKATREELVAEIVVLQDQVGELEKTLWEAKQNSGHNRTLLERPAGFNTSTEYEKIRVFKREISKLIIEIDVLQRENDSLRSLLARRQ